jgi:hypothetical protein
MSSLLIIMQFNENIHHTTFKFKHNQTVTNQINQRTEKLLFITKTFYSLIIIHYKNSKRLHVSTHKSMACHNKTSQFNLQLTF